MPKLSGSLGFFSKNNPLLCARLKKDFMKNETAQITRNILMVRPAHFGYNSETAQSNAFQKNDLTAHEADIEAAAIREFDSLVEKLRAVGVYVIVANDTTEPVKPDAVFPNNWVTFHEDGTVVTYPLLSAVRRQERREDIILKLRNSFQVKRRIQLEEYENTGQMLEGTGSMIIDRPNGLVYACLSPRTNPILLEQFCELMNYEAVPFHAIGGGGQEIYHTNVMMALGEEFVVICLDVVPDKEESELLRKKFMETKMEIIEISPEQMVSFAGNMLQVKGAGDSTYLVMSETAHSSLSEAQVEQIQRHTNILYSPIPTIETYGGGSVRCMMAEVFLPEK